MRTITIFCFFTFFLLLPSYLFSQEYIYVEKCKIERIEKTKNGYIISIIDEEHDEWYDIVSLKTKTKKLIREKMKIKVGKHYDITLIPYFERYIISPLGLLLTVKIDNVEIKVTCNSWTSNIYTTSNLKGLYYMPSPM